MNELILYANGSIVHYEVTVPGSYLMNGSTINLLLRYNTATTKTISTNYIDVPNRKAHFKLSSVDLPTIRTGSNNFIVTLLESGESVSYVIQEGVIVWR